MQWIATRGNLAGSHPDTKRKVFELFNKIFFDGIKVLDLGAGRGDMSDQINQHFISKKSKNSSILAVDISEHTFNAPGVSFEKWDLNETFPCEENQFDFVFSIEVLEHLHNPYRFISECHRVLKPGGFVVLTTPNNLNIGSRIRYFLCGFPKLYEPPSIHLKNAGRLCGHVMPIHAAYVDYGLRRVGFADQTYLSDKLHSSSLFFYYSLFPFWFALRERNLRHVKNYDPEVFQECRGVLELMESRILLASRSLIASARKSS